MNFLVSTQPSFLPCPENDNRDHLIALYLSQRDDQGLPRFTPKTVSNYQRDIRRFLLFLGDDHLQSMTLEKVQAFISWLREPPVELIHSTTRFPYHHPEWKPFYQTGLSSVALKQQMASIKAFYRWLHDCGYLQTNPFSLVKSGSKRKIKTERHLIKDDLSIINDILISKTPVDDALRVAEVRLSKDDLVWVRYRWIWKAYSLSGFRLSELINSDPFDIKQHKTDKNLIWCAYIQGKGKDEPDFKPVHDSFIEEYQRYRACLNLSRMPTKKGEGFFFTLLGRKTITSRSSVHNIFKDMIREVSSLLIESGFSDVADRINTSSVHWMRHSFATQLLNTTNDLPLASKLIGHKDLQTLMTYDHSEMDEMFNLLNKINQR